MAEFVLFAHTQGQLGIVEVKVPETITESELIHALETAGVLGAGEVLVFVDEAEEHIHRHDHRPVNGLHHGVRIHLARCHHIRTFVHYQDRTIERNFSPGAKIRTVKAWAVHEFHLDHKDAAEHVLQISNSRDRPASDTPLHVLVPVGSCDISFDLVPEKRIEGADEYCSRS